MCPLVYCFHCPPHISIFLYCLMNLFPLLLKLLWLWKQNQKLPEPSKSMKIYCFISLNMSYYVIFPEIWVTRLLHCQWHISFCMVWEPREGSRAADCFPVTAWATFPTASSSSRCLLLQTDLHSLGCPKEVCIPVFYWLWLLHKYYLLVSFLDGEPAVLLAWPRFWSPCLLILNMVPAHVLGITWQEQILFFPSHASCPGPCLP